MFVSHNREVKNPRTSTIVFLSALLLLAWGCWADYSPAIARHWIGEFSDKQLQRASNLGDSFGPFNALVSTIGLAAILGTLALQARALRERRADLHRQRFESTFFELLRLLRELRNEISFSYSKEYIEERNPSQNLFSKVSISSVKKKNSLLNLGCLSTCTPSLGGEGWKVCTSPRL
jgi:hypothetical protein